MRFLTGLLSALGQHLSAALSAVGNALGRGARATGRAARATGRSIVAVVPGQWTQRIALLFATGLALVPIIYAGNMTWSFNDPSGHLNRVTAAVVNEDVGATATSPDGTKRHIDVGKDFTKTLLDMDKRTVFTFVRTDRATAEKGLADGTYGALVEVPRTFSADVASLGGDDAAKAAPALLTVRTNDTVNYVSGNFTKSVGTALRQSLAANVLDEYLDNVYIGFSTVHSSLIDAADGAHKLNDGATQLHDGTGKLATGSADLATGAGSLESGSYDLVVGLGQLADGADTLSTGNRALASGAGQLSSGLHTLDSSGAQLRSGSGQLADGTAQAADGSRTLAGGTTKLAAGTQQLDDGVTRAQQRLRALGIDKSSVDRAAADLSTAVDDLAASATRLDQTLEDPAVRAKRLAEVTRTNAAAVDRAAADSRALADAVAASGKDTSALTAAADALDKRAAEADQKLTDAQKSVEAHPAAAQKLSRDVQDYTGSVDDLAAQCADSGASEAFCAKLRGTAESSHGLRTEASQVSAQAAAIARSVGAAATIADDIHERTQGIRSTAAQVHELLAGGSGHADLVTRTDQVATNLEKLRTPAHDVADAAQVVSDRIEAAKKQTGPDATGRDVVQKRIDTLHRQASTAVAEIPVAYGTVRTAADAVHQINDGAATVNSGAQRLSAANQKLAAGASTLDDGVKRYTGGVHTAATSSDQLVAGAEKAAAGASRLAAAAHTASSGAAKLHDGAAKLHDGADTLHEGALSAQDGAAQLQDGSKKLADGLDDGAGKVPDYTDSERKHLASVASDPVHLEFSRDNGLDRFGEGLVPLFLGIGLWVGGMSIFLMMPPLSERAARAGVGPFGLLMGGLLPAQLLGLVQTVIAVTILHFWVDISAKDLGMFFAMACLTSVVFVALNHAFGALFGPVGKFVALVLIALQVSGAGGTYPVQTLPAFFRTIHPWLPMTHAVNAFRGAIGGAWIDPAGDLAWLLGWLALALAMGLMAAIRMHRKAQHDMSGEIPATA